MAEGKMEAQEILLKTFKNELDETKKDIATLRKQIVGLHDTNKKNIQKVEKMMKQILKQQAQANSSSSADKMLFKPIGRLQSIFKFKNGTPRQPTVCKQARGQLTIDPSVFSNPEHSLEGLQSFTHAWIFFVFHKNNNDCLKPKVKPPRLDGMKVGLFSTRCPYRPNPIGLTLAKIEKIEGPTVYFSGIDILDGTPVLDIKPYISNYDLPQDLPSEMTIDTDAWMMDEAGDADDLESRKSDDESAKMKRDLLKNTVSLKNEVENFAQNVSLKNEVKLLKNVSENVSKSEVAFVNNDSEKDEILSNVSETVSTKSEVAFVNNDLENNANLLNVSTKTEASHGVEDVQSSVSSNSSQINSFNVDEKSGKTSESDDVTTEAASWISKPPIEKLEIRFTNYSSDQIEKFHAKNDRPYILEQFKDSHELKEAIVNILSADPRSVYRRNRCQDRLYYFCVDNAHVTCWFNGNVAEVVRVQPMAFRDRSLKQPE